MLSHRAKKRRRATAVGAGRGPGRPDVPRDRIRSSAARGAWLALLVVAAGAWAYLGGLAGPLVWDDLPHIVGDRGLRSLGWEVLLGSRRPLVRLSLALDYAAGGLDVRVYHLTNVALHLLVALVLFALVRRTLATPRLAPRFAASAPWLAAAVASIWVVHPLTTEAVTWVIQRAEVLASLFFLLVLYTLARSAEGRARAAWQVASVASCALGLASKEIVATAPLVALLYDRAFLSGSLRGALARRGRVHLALWACLALVPLFLAANPHEWQPSTGARPGLDPLHYGLTELSVVLHYLRLAFWPHPLILDYGWPLARGVRDVAWAAWILPPLIAWTAWALARNRAAAFLAAAFFIVLAPTSSLIPIADAAFEHRMYLPLAAVVTLVLAAAHDGLARLRPAGGRAVAVASGIAVVMLVVVLGERTRLRNATYRSEIALWTDNVERHPRNPRPYVQLGTALAAEGRVDEAAARFREALRLKPDYGAALGNLGRTLEVQGRLEEAIDAYRRALALDPDLPWTRCNLGVTLRRVGRRAEALEVLGEGARRDPGFAEVRVQLGLALAEAGRADDAALELRAALALEPGHEVARRALAGLWGGAPRGR
jgi:tetratricopeptide (TPR) repeat protein